MSLRCLFLQKRFVPYLEGALTGREAGRLDRHLAGCRECRELFARVRSGHSAGRRFGRLGQDPGSRPPEFEKIWEGMVADPGGRLSAGRASSSTVRPIFRPRLVAGLLALLVVPAVIFVAFLRRPSGRDYRPLSIRDFAGNSHGRVVTEGFIHKVYFDEEERTLHIKLVETPHAPGPFVICEVRDSRGLTVPQEGSRIRVYGTARYDAQPGRGWHEVNPVMDISVLKR
jgi:hypothetical protein